MTNSKEEENWERKWTVGTVGEYEMA